MRKISDEKNVLLSENRVPALTCIAVLLLLKPHSVYLKTNLVAIFKSYIWHISKLDHVRIICGVYTL